MPLVEINRKVQDPGMASGTLPRAPWCYGGALVNAFSPPTGMDHLPLSLRKVLSSADRELPSL